MQQLEQYKSEGCVDEGLLREMYVKQGEENC